MRSVTRIRDNYRDTKQHPTFRLHLRGERGEVNILGFLDLVDFNDVNLIYNEAVAKALIPDASARFSETLTRGRLGATV